VSHYISKKRIRYSFGSISNAFTIPNLIKIQKQSYENFLQFNSFNFKKNQGLENILRSNNKIEEPSGRIVLEYINYRVCPPKYEPKECIYRGVTYSCILKITFRLLLWEDKVDRNKEIKGVKEQEIVFGNIPLMTNQGTFIINGNQKVIVSQLYRSPGIFYTVSPNVLDKNVYLARIIPFNGSWIDFELKDTIYFKIDKKKKNTNYIAF